MRKRPPVEGVEAMLRQVSTPSQKESAPSETKELLPQETKRRRKRKRR